jgi:drug/metabolite transporter (DMT)-like permease
VVSVASSGTTLGSQRAARLKGIAAMLAAVCAFACMDALLKLLVQHYPTMQVTAMRGAASLPFLLAPLLFTGRLRDLRPVRWRMHLMRGLLSVVLLASFVFSIRTLSLADAYAIFLSAPLIVTALSVPLLGEHVGWRRWIAITVGMCGVLVMLRPTGSNLVSLGALAAVFAAVAYAVNAITVRVLTRTETTASVVFWSIAIMTLCTGVIAAPAWVALRLEHWWWVAATGAVGALGAHFLTEAFRAAPASVVAPFEYAALLWAFTFDWFIWDTLPSARVYLGGGIVIASGLYLILRESQLHLAPVKPATGAGSAA